MSVSTFKRTSIVLGKDGAGQDFKAFGDTPGAYIRWDHANNKLVFAGGADMDFGSFGTPLTINQANNYPLGIFGHVSVANALGTNVERGLWVRTKVSANQTGAFSIFGGQLQFRWADGCALLGSGVENAQYGGAWLYLEQDTTGQALADYAHASGVVVQVETFGALTIPTNAHLSGVKVESRLGAANGAVISLNSGTIAGVFITKSPAASGVTAQNWPFGIVIEDCDKGIDTSGMVVVPDSGRTKFAFAMGNRDQELTINLANAASQNLELFQTNVNLTCTAGAPTSTSTVALLRLRSTHDTTNMPNLRLRSINSYMDVRKNIADAYGCIHGIDFYTNAVAVGGEAAVGVFNMECNSAVTGNVRGLIVNLYGSGLPASTSIGAEIRCDGSPATTLGEGVRIWPVGTNTITTGLVIRGNVTQGIDFANVSFEPESTKAHFAIGIGDRNDVLIVNFHNAVSQHFEPVQMNMDLKAPDGAPTSTSTMNMMYAKLNHDTVDMPNLRLKCTDFNVVIGENVKDAYVFQGEIDFDEAGITVGGEVAGLGMSINAGTQAVTGTIHGIRIWMGGNGGMPAQAVGLEIHATCTTALARGIAIYGTPQTTVGIAFGDEVNDNQGPTHAFFIPSGPGADEGPHVNTAESGDGAGSIKIKVGSTTKYLQYWDNAA